MECSHQHPPPVVLCHLLDGTEELAHGQILWDQELDLVQRGQRPLPGISLHNHLLGGRPPGNVAESSQCPASENGGRQWALGCSCYFCCFDFSSRDRTYPFSKSTSGSYRDLVWELCLDSSNFLSTGCCEHFKYKRISKQPREVCIHSPLSGDPDSYIENFT